MKMDCKSNDNKRSLILLGMGPSAWQCPYDAETWGLNMGYQIGQKLDKLFIVHTQVYSPEGNPYFNWEDMSKQGFEIISLHRIKGLNSTLFPLKRIARKFQTEYFSCTISYMLAYALDKCTTPDLKLRADRPYSKFRLYGIDMLAMEERAWEKGSIEFWIGLARGLGIPVTNTQGSQVLNTNTGKPYGFKLSKNEQWKNLDPVGLLGKKQPSKEEAFGGFEFGGDLSKVTYREMIRALGG